MIDDIERLLLNWQAWSFGHCKSPLGYATVRWDHVRTGGYHSDAVPITAGEAAEIDDAILTLAAPLQTALRLEYLQPAMLKGERAKAAGCHHGTFINRLARAKRDLREELIRRRAVRERVRLGDRPRA